MIKTQRNQTNEFLLKELNQTAKFGQDIQGVSYVSERFCEAV